VSIPIFGPGVRKCFGATAEIGALVGFMRCYVG